MKRLIGPVLTTIAIVTILVFIIRDGMVGALLETEPTTLVLLLALSSVGLTLRGQQLANVSRPFGVRFALGEPTGLSALHTLSNYLPGRAGLVIRGAYLRRFHDLSVADYTAMTALWLVGSLLSAVILGLAVAVAASEDVHRSSALAVFSLCGISLIGGYAALQWIVGRGRGSSRVTRWLTRVHAGLQLWQKPGRWRGWFVVWSFGLLLAHSVRYWVALRALGDPHDLSAAIVIQSLVSLSVLVSLTPGNIGVREGMAAFGAFLTGVDPEIALLAAVIDRAAGLAMSVLGFSALGVPLVKRFRQSAASEPSPDS